MGWLVLFVAGGLAFGAPAQAAETGDMRRIGYLTMDAVAIHAPVAAAFREGLREARLVEGRNVTIEWRYAANDSGALAGLVSELMGLKIEVLVTDGTQAALAARRATSTVPIVVPTSGDLVRTGLVASLARPAGNVTGLTLMSPGLVGKRLARLKEMAPSIRRVAVLVNPDNPGSVIQLEEAQAEAPRLGLEVQAARVRRAGDIDGVLGSLAGRVQAILLSDDPLLDAQRTRIGTPAVWHRLPSMLRAGIRTHRDSTGHALCWHHPALWGLLPEQTDPLPTVPTWPEFLRGCIQYRQSLDEQLPDAPRSEAP